MRRIHWTVGKVMAATVGLFLVAILLLYQADAPTLDVTLTVTLLIVLFGFQLNNERRMTRIEDNIIHYISSNDERSDRSDIRIGTKRDR